MPGTAMRPPFPASAGVSLAVAYFAASAGLSAVQLPWFVVIVVADGDSRSAFRLVVMYVVVALIGGLAVALARRRAWARVPSIGVAMLMMLGAACGVVWALLRSEEHGSGYVLLGALGWFVFGAVVVVKLVTTAGPEAFRPRSAGWLSDPSNEARLRYWDGEHWTPHVAP